MHCDKWPLLVTVGAIPGSVGNAQETPFSLASVCMLPRMSPMVSGDGVTYVAHCGTCFTYIATLPGYATSGLNAPLSVVQLWPGGTSSQLHNFIHQQQLKFFFPNRKVGKLKHT